MTAAMITYMYAGMGGCCLLYFLLLKRYCGRVPAFGGIWLWNGLGMIALGMSIHLLEKIEKKGIFSSAWMEKILLIVQEMTGILCILLVCFLFWILFLAREGNRKPASGADYVVVLGAKVNGSNPSRALKSRIVTASSYLKDNPTAKVVVTGGKGEGEEISEALCMKRALLALGIEEKRILLEDRSTNTVENITFASRLIEKKDSFVVVVTNDFHALRGRLLADRAGFVRVESLGAPSAPLMKLHYYTRETFSWMKLWIVTKKRT